jgi:type VI secretion system Hcp family effector
MAGFMYIQGIPGEVTQGTRAALTGPPPDKVKGPSPTFYHGWIELHSVTQTVTRAIESGRSGTARARAACVLEDIEIEKEVDQSSTALINAVSGGRAFDEVWIHLCSAMAGGNDDIPGQSLHPYFEMRLFSVKVTSYTINGSGLDDGSIPVETINLNFDRVQWKYWPIGPVPPNNLDAGPNDVHKVRLAGWDIVKSTSFVPPED